MEEVIVDLHSPENITRFAHQVYLYEKHDRCGDYHLAIDALRQAIHCCPYSSLGVLLEARLKSYKPAESFNFWSWLGGVIGSPKKKGMRGITSEKGGTVWVKDAEAAT